MGRPMSKDWKGGTTQWLPAEHRQIIALVRDLTERLGRLPVDLGAGPSASLAAVHRQGLDAILGDVMSHGDRVRVLAETSPAEPIPVARTFYVAVCDVCTFLSGGEGLEMPFWDQDARAEWCRAHTEGTGHAKWTAFTVPAPS